MTRKRNGSVYQPLIQQPDKIIRLPMNGTGRILIKRFRHLAKSLSEEKQREAFAKLFNLVALFSANQGRYDDAYRLCEAQIYFWKELSSKMIRKSDIKYILQPWVNIVRLERWRKNTQCAASLYREFFSHRMMNYGEFNRRYDIAPSLQDICEIDKNLYGLINYLCLREYPLLLLSSGEYLELQENLRYGFKINHEHFLGKSLLEISLIYQTRIGNFDNALTILKNVNISQEDGFSLHFQALEMYLHIKIGSPEAKTKISDVLRLSINKCMTSRQVTDLSTLIGIAKIFEMLSLFEQERVLLNSLQEMAKDINDEVFLFEIIHRLYVLECVPKDVEMERFQHSAYATVRTGLGLDTSNEEECEASHRIAQAASQLVHLDFDAFNEILSEEYSLI